MFKDFNVVDIQANKISLKKTKNLVLNKLLINYEALIKRTRDE